MFYMMNIFLQTEMSKDTLGYVIYQENEDGRKNIIKIPLTGLKQTQKNWEIMEV